MLDNQTSPSEKLKIELSKALSIMNSSLYENKFDKLYRFTTENIGEYIQSFDLANKSLLTVGSSADQALNSILLGCRDITVFDICPFTNHYYNLKKSAIIKLDYYKFREYLCDDVVAINKYLFSKKLFNEIKDTLEKVDYNSFRFWCKLYHGYRKYRFIPNLFVNHQNSMEDTIRYNLYLQNKNNFNILKQKIVTTNPNFIVGDILNVKTCLCERKFDNIILSNIYEHIKHDKNKLNLFKTTLNSLKNNLNENGKILVSYLYMTFMEEDFIQDFNDVFKTGLSQISVNGNANRKDSIIVYQKKI